MQSTELEILLEAVSIRLNPENRFRFSVRSEDLSDRELAVLSASAPNDCLCGYEGCPEGWFTFRQNLSSPSEEWLASKECVPFWTMFDSLSDDKSEAVNELQARLQQLDPDVLEKFQLVFEYLHKKADFRDMWVAGSIIEGSLSDDGFTDFRTGLIAQGQDIYEAAINNPDNLADYIFDTDYSKDIWISNESIAYVAVEVYEEKTNSEEDIRDVVESLSESFWRRNIFPETVNRVFTEQWDYENEEVVKNKLPKIHSKFGASIDFD